MEDCRLNCPVCNKALNAEDRLGFKVYVCDEHGTWLFKGVLREMLWKFSRADSAMLSQAVEELDKLKGSVGWPTDVGPPDDG